MAIRIKAPKQQAAAVSARKGVGLPDLFPESAQPTVEKLGTFLGWGSRVGSGILGAEGGVPGAAFGAGGEALAQFLEGSLDRSTTPARVGVEASIGVVPFGKIASGRHTLNAAAKTGVMGGVGDLGRQWAEGRFTTPETTLEDLVTGKTPKAPGLDIGRFALATILGGGAGAIFNKFNPIKQAAKAPADEVVIESSGAVPRYQSGSGLPMNAPRNEAPATTTPFTDRDTIAAGKTELSAGRAEPSTANYAGGVKNIQSLLATTSAAPTTLHGPRTLAGRIAYTGDDFNPKILDDLEKQFNNAMTGADNRFMAEQKGYDAFASQLERALGANINTLPNRTAESLLEGRKMLDEAIRASDDLAKSWQAGDIAALDKQFSTAMNAADTRFATQAKLAKEQAKRDLIQRRRNAAGLEKETSFSSSVRSETPTGVVETMTTKFRPPKTDENGGDEGVRALNDLLTGKTPEVAADITKAAKGASGRTTELLSNLDEEGMKYFTYLRNVMGESDGSAYKKAIYEQKVREARVARPQAQVRPEPQAEVPVTAAKAVEAPPVSALQDILSPAERVRQSAHPSFFDDGVEGLENAADVAQRQATTHPSFYDEGFEGLEDVSKHGKKAPPTGKPPAEAQAKLDAAEATYQPEAMEELRRLSALYNDPNTDKATRKQVGKELRQLSDFMSGKKPPSKGGITLGAGLGGAQDILRIAQENPEFATSTLTGAMGALAGGALDASDGSDTWWDGALAGATLGAAGPQMPKIIELVKSQIDPTNQQSIKEWAKWIAAKSPQVQRASLLANPQGGEQGMPAIAMNAIAGPYGAVMTTAIESIMKNDPRGARLMQLLDGYNPMTGFGIPKFIKGAWESSAEAAEALRRGEGGRSEIGGINPDSVPDKILSLPGQAMTMGDIYARKLLKLAGYSDDEARVATLTAEPEQFRQVANWGKNNWLMQMMFPFRRTPANILEQGYKRIPGIGMIANKASGNDQAIEQTLGGLFGVANYGIAANIDDDTTRRNVRRLMSNVGGRYSLPGQLGYFAGDAAARNLSPWSAITNVRSLEQIVPVPAVDVIADAGRKTRDTLQGNIDSPLDLLPTSMSFKPLRQFFGDRLAASGYPGARDILQVEPPPTRGIRIKRPRRP